MDSHEKWAVHKIRAFPFCGTFVRNIFIYRQVFGQLHSQDACRNAQIQSSGHPCFIRARAAPNCWNDSLCVPAHGKKTSVMNLKPSVQYYGVLNPGSVSRFHPFTGHEGP